MRMMKKKPEPKQIKKKQDDIKEAMPQDKLDKFLEDKISREEMRKVTEIRATNVFDNFYRVNAWMEEYKDESICPRVWIGYSWFLKYEDGKIMDKTIEPKPKKEKIF